MWAILKREFKSLFQTVIGWLFLAVNLGLFGLYFYVYNLVYGYPLLSNTLSAITFIFLITVPVLTMRVLAEEKRSRTDQLILTAPVSVGKVVLGKFLALSAIFSIAVLVMCFTPLLLSGFGKIPYGECYTALFGFWLFGLACIAIGVFWSSVTESQVIAAVLTFAALFLGYMMQSITAMISTSGNVVTKILGCYDLTAGLDEFFSGVFDLQAFLYYGSLVFLFLFLTVQVIQKRRFCVSSRNLKTGAFSMGLIGVALAVVVFVNLIGTKLPEGLRAIDVTSQKLYSVTEETKRVLSALEEDVTIYVLENENAQDETLGKMLERYEAASSHIQVVYKDPAVFPSFYTNYTDGNITRNSLIVEGSKRYKVLDFSSLYQTEMDYTTYSSSVTGYDGEGQLTSAVTYVTNQENPVIYQLTGHEEQAVSGAFADAVSKLNMTLESLNLLEVSEVPKDAAVLMINAPAKDLSADDVEKIQAYLDQGKKAVVTVGYTEEKLPNFESILAGYGVTVAEGLVLEGDQTAFYQVPYYLLAKASYDEATNDVSGDYIFIPYAKGLQYPKETEAGTEPKTASETEAGDGAASETESGNETDNQKTDVSYQELLGTSAQAYAKGNAAAMETFEKEEGDVEGPFALGLRVTKGDTTLYVFSGDGIFTEEASQMVYGNNAALFAGVLSQFADNGAVSVIPVKNYGYERLTIHQAGVILSGLGTAIVVPVGLLAAGIVIWVRRRRK